MGTDLFTSSRGAGVIGTFMAVFVLIGFGVLYILVFDKSLQGGGQTIESVISNDLKSVDLLKGQIVSSRERIESVKGHRAILTDIEEAKLKSVHQEKRITELESSAANEREALATKANAWEDYKQAYRQSERSAAAGERLPELKTLSGVTYTKVKITDVDAVRMQIRHSGGIKGIPFEELPLDLQDRFQFDIDEKEARVATEVAQVAKGRIGSSIGDLKIAIADLKHQNTQATRKITQLEQALANAKAAEPNLKVQLNTKQRELSDDLNQRSARTSTGRKGISRAPQIRAEISHIEKQILLASTRIPKLSEQITREEDAIGLRNRRLAELQLKLDELVGKMKDSSTEEDS